MIPSERPAAVPFSDAEERAVRASVTDTTDRHVHDDEYVSWKARDIRRLLATLDAARLSHDRGADADAAWKVLVTALYGDGTQTFDHYEDIVERHRPAIEAALLSVPAPTLPALDVSPLADAMADPLTFALMEDMRAGRIPGRWEQVVDIMVERHPRLREALRDVAAPTEEERQHE